jgi:hypothetical protein
MTKLAYVVMVLSGVGVSLCLSLYLLGITGVFLLPPKVRLSCLLEFF